MDPRTPSRLRDQITRPAHIATHAATGKATRSGHRWSVRRGPVQQWLSETWGAALDALLPRQCALCDDWLGPDEHGLCGGCLEALPGRETPRCQRCALRLEDGPAAADGLGSDDRVGEVAGVRPPPPCCIGCRGTAHALGRAITLCDYAPPIDRALVAGKFQGQTTVLHRLGDALSASLGGGTLPPDAVLVPVPLSDERLTERGYNQAEILARVLGRRLGLRCRSRALRRTRHTASQSALNRMDREANLREAFACRMAVSGRTIVLVDDVMTTGATLEAAAACLRTAGALAVIGLVIARTPAPRVPARTA